MMGPIGDVRDPVPPRTTGFGYVPPDERIADSLSLIAMSLAAITPRLVEWLDSHNVAEGPQEPE